MHSDITLKSDSWLPRHVKVNFVSNSVRQVAEKCSDSGLTHEALDKLDSRFRKNGFKNVNYDKILESENKRNDCDASPIFLKIPFVNDRLNKKNQKHPQRL